jgi:CRISPR/Cas system-associated endoribonuclease Cas2
VNSTKYFVNGDTLIGSKHYSKVWMQTDSLEFSFDMNKATYYAAIRNDTTNKKVYGVYYKADSVYSYDHWNQTYSDLLPITINCDTCELLLYDFNIRITTVDYYVYSFPFRYRNSHFMGAANSKRYEHIIQYHITSIFAQQDTIMGVIRNVIYPYNGSDQWIEGIGGTAGLFSYGNYRLTYNGETELLCVNEKENLTYKLDSVCYRQIIKDVGGVYENNLIKIITISPNPVQSKTTITFNSTDNSSIIYIYDMLGKLVFEKNHLGKSNTEEIDLTVLPKGMYCMIIKADNKIIQKTKLIKL